jgi:hypothetical protein
VNAEIFAQHLDLTRLGQRARGVVPCIFHHDKTASLSVDLDKGVFHCFGCGEQGGVKRFANLVGAPAAHGGGTPRRPQNDLVAELRAAYQRTRRFMAEWVPVYQRADEIRHASRLVDDARRAATRLGDCDAAWDLLTLAADVERDVFTLEAMA